MDPVAASLSPRPVLSAFRKNAEDSLLAFCLDLPEHFRLLGYTPAPSFVQDFMALTGGMEAETLAGFASFEELEPLLEPLVVRTPAEHASFHRDYLLYVKDRGLIVVDEEEEGKYLKRLIASRDEADRKAASLEKMAGQKRKKAEELQKKAEESDTSVISKRTSVSNQKKLSAVQREYEKLLKGSPHEKELKDLPAMADGELAPPGNPVLDAMKAELKVLTGKAVLCKNYKEVLDYLRIQAGLIDKLKKGGSSAPLQELKKVQEELGKAEEEYERARERLLALRDEVASLTGSPQASRIVFKTAARSHRPPEATFPYGNAVQALAENPAFSKSFGALTEGEKESIRQYILENARSFRTRMTRNIRTGAHRRLDLPATVGAACRFGGVPLLLRYRKPARSRAKLTMILDISGSCRGASEMMLTFMHEMREVFPAGCDTYVFVNRLYDVSDIFAASRDARSSVDGILSAVPNRGVYSDYHQPLQTFVQEHLARITKDSIVLFMGDARNNNNPSGEEYLKRICRKARRAYWLNTESREDWNTGDSILHIYAPYLDQVAEVLTVGQLLTFLLSVR